MAGRTEVYGRYGETFRKSIFAHNSRENKKFLALVASSTEVILAYIYWRIFDTLPAA